MIINFKMYVE